jgi:hypothetical protein
VSCGATGPCRKSGTAAGWEKRGPKAGLKRVHRRPEAHAGSKEDRGGGGEAHRWARLRGP